LLSTQWITSCLYKRREIHWLAGQL